MPRSHTPSLLWCSVHVAVAWWLGWLLYHSMPGWSCDRPACVPTIVQVPGWRRRDIPLCLPNVQYREIEVADKDLCLPAEEMPATASEEVPGAASRSESMARSHRSSYRRVRRPGPLPTPREANPEVLDSQALRQGLAAMQAILDRLQVVQPDGDHITPEMAAAIDQAAEFQATIARLQGVQPGSKRLGDGVSSAIEQAQVLQETCEVASPPAGRLNSTTEHENLGGTVSPPSSSTGMEDTQPVAQRATGRKSKSEWQTYGQGDPAASVDTAMGTVGPLSAAAPPSMLTGVGRQAPWSGAALVSPPWAVRMPAPSSPVTTNSIDNDIDVGLGRRTSDEIRHPSVLFPPMGD